MTSTSDVAGEYATRAAVRREQQAVLERKSRRFGAARLVAFMVAVALTIMSMRAVAGSVSRRTDSIAAAAVWLAFVVLVVLGSRVARRARRTGALAALNEQGAHRVRREWSELPEQSWPTVPPTHPYAHDLDLFGPASL